MQTYPDWKIIELIEAYMQGSNNADLQGYREQTRQRDFANKQGILWSLKLVSTLGQYKNKRILDVGCGFGWHSFGLSLLNRGSKVLVCPENLAPSPKRKVGGGGGDCFRTCWSGIRGRCVNRALYGAIV